MMMMMITTQVNVKIISKVMQQCNNATDIQNGGAKWFMQLIVCKINIFLYSINRIIHNYCTTAQYVSIEISTVAIINLWVIILDSIKLSVILNYVYLFTYFWDSNYRDSLQTE